jgi:hypothetical protein
MTESAPEPQKPKVDEKRRWPHIVGLIAIGLIAFGAIVVAVTGFCACWPNSGGQSRISVSGVLKVKSI